MRPRRPRTWTARRSTGCARRRRRSVASITGSLIIRDGDRHYNRLLWVRPDGRLSHYDKRHLFRMVGEHENFAAGDRCLTVELKGWRIWPFICYDLRFPGLEPLA